MSSLTHSDPTAAKQASSSGSTSRQGGDNLLRSLYFSENGSNRLTRFIAALYRGFWRGVWDEHDINAFVVRLYEQNDWFGSAEHNLQGFFPWEAELLHEHFDGCSSLVVGAAGGGREMIAAARAGWRVEGFECHPVLVQKCKEYLSQVGVSAEIFQAAPDEVPAHLPTYDAAIVGCGALGHIVGRSKRVKFLKDLKSHLKDGTPVLLSVGRRPEGSRYYKLIYQTARAMRLFRSSNSVEVGDDPFDLYTHRFTEAELHAELRQAGFRVVKSVEGAEIYVVAGA